MTAFTRKVASAAAPVFGVALAIAILRAAGVPFPPALEWGAWAQWAVFCSVVYTCIALCFHVADRLGGTGAVEDPGATRRA